MPYPHVTQLETRLRFDRIAHSPRPRRARSRRPWWLTLLIVGAPASRNVGGYR